MCIFNTTCEGWHCFKTKDTRSVIVSVWYWSEKADTTFVDLDPVTKGRETTSLTGNGGRGASSSKPITGGKKIVPTVKKALQIIESKN